MKMFKRFPSYDQIVRGAVSTAARFPFTLISALVGVVAAATLAGLGQAAERHSLDQLLVTAALGLPLFTALVMLAEKRGWSSVGRLLFQAVGLVLLIVYYLTLPAKLDEPMNNLVRFALLNIGLHFLVAWLPWTGKDQVVGFWEYNKTLFLRILFSALYSAVLFVGLALALLAADQLFGVEVKNERYFQLWIWITGLFNTWVFLAGVPKNLEVLNRGGEYPNGLKVFTQFILLPLVVLYFVILFAYEAKIIITWDWPKGWVSELVLWYSVVGILSLLLLHPLRDRLENRWIQAISKWFYRGLIPLVAMLFLAIMRRISEYGITENRYFVFAMAVGLTIVMIYMVVSKRKDVRLIPIVVCLIAFISAYGPWSALAISRSSQQSRLDALMTKCGLLAGGSLQKPTVEPSLEDRQEMSSEVVYLNKMHGTDAFSGWLADNVLRGLDSVSQGSRAEQITGKLGFVYANTSWRPKTSEYFHLAADDIRPIDISGYDLILPFWALTGSDTTRKFSIDQDSCWLVFDSAACNLTFRVGTGSSNIMTTTVIPLKEPLIALMDSSTTEKLTSQDLTFRAVGADTTTRVWLEIVNGRRTEAGLEINWLNGLLMIRRP